MAITNNYIGFEIATAIDLAASDKDSDFGENLNRSIAQINRNYAVQAGIRNTYAEGYVNQFGSSARFSTNEQRLVQNMVKESININGITVRYMPRYSEYPDHVWNERPESLFDRGTQMDMILVAAAGFEGEGDVMTQYGIEFREEVILSMAMPRFDELYGSYYNGLDEQGKSNFVRTRPMEGDLIVVPFGRSSQNKNQYVPKVFEITRVTAYHDGAFFQLGDNYQYKIRAKLFELSGEDLEFNPTVVKYEVDGSETFVSGDSDSKISRAKDPGILVDSDTGRVNIVKDSDVHLDSWADNYEIEERAQTQKLVEDDKVVETAKLIKQDLTARAFGYGSVIDNLDDI